MTPAPTLQELINIVQAEATSAEPLDRLSAAAATAAELTDTSDSLLSHFVDQARRAGHSWTEISTALGVTKQAAHKRFTPPTPSFERFTPRARRILEHAVAEAGRLGHTYVGTEHVLLSLFDEPESIAGKLLTGGGLTRDDAEREVLKRVPRGPATHSTLVPFTPRAAALAGGSIEEALLMGHNYIGTEHILLALFRDPDTVGAKALTALGVEREPTRVQIVQMLSGFTAT